MAKWEVQTVFLYELENCWKDEHDKPQYYKTKREAQRALAEHIDDLHESYVTGDLPDRPSYANFHIRQLFAETFTMGEVE